MTVLVTAASRHGATGEIAARVGAVLAEHGVDVEVRKPEEVSDLAPYEGFVVGSAIYMGRWLKEARRFVDAHAGELAERPTWLFSSGPVGDPPVPDPADEEAGRHALEITNAREHRVFAGKLDPSKLGVLEKAAVRAAHASEGDHRDWGEVEEWAAAIARELQQSRAGSPSAPAK